jgi:hypothetical protein
MPMPVVAGQRGWLFWLGLGLLLSLPSSLTVERDGPVERLRDDAGRRSTTHLPLCDEDDMFTGEWVFHSATEEISDSRTLSGCPLSRCLIDDHPIISKNNDFSKGSFKSASYVNSQCRIMEVPLAAAIMDRAHGVRKTTIAFIGDSIGRQMYSSALCDVEHFNLSQHFELSYTLDVHLRIQNFCHEKCTTNETFLSRANLIGFPNPCLSCPQGVRVPKSVHDDMRSTNHWINRVPPEVDVLVFNSGAWYSSIFFTDSITAYEETITTFAKQIKPVVDNGVTVVWTALPPSYANKLKDVPPISRKYADEWKKFEYYNEFAEKTLAPLGVLVVNADEPAIKRLRQDPNITFDGMHWRAPAAHSVPHFITRSIFHRVAINMVKVFQQLAPAEGESASGTVNASSSLMDAVEGMVEIELSKSPTPRHNWLANSTIVSSDNPLTNPASTEPHHYLLSEGDLRELPSKYVAQCLLWYAHMPYLNMTRPDIDAMPKDIPITPLVSA